MYKFTNSTGLEGEQCFLAVYGEEIVAVNNLGRGIHHSRKTCPLAAEQLVGTLYSQVAHGVGILDDKGIH